MKLTQVIFRSLSWIHLSHVHKDSGLRWYPTELTEVPADSTDLELVISCSSVSCLINTEPLELLRLQPSEPIASESEDSLIEFDIILPDSSSGSY